MPSRPPRATSPPPLRRAASGIHGPRTCEHGGRGTNHLALDEGPWPAPAGAGRLSRMITDGRSAATLALCAGALLAATLAPSAGASLQASLDAGALVLTDVTGSADDVTLSTNKTGLFVAVADKANTLARVCPLGSAKVPRLSVRARAAPAHRRRRRRRPPRRHAPDRAPGG